MQLAHRRMTKEREEREGFERITALD